MEGKCFTCNKRIGLTGFKCKCLFVFCSTHRYAGKHDCPFDYKTCGQSMIEKTNPVIRGEKVIKL